MARERIGELLGFPLIADDEIPPGIVRLESADGTVLREIPMPPEEEQRG